jgi:hypothetical protein
MEQLVTYLAIGAIGGLFAGLLGVGGGIVVVPALVIVFSIIGLPQEHLLHLAIGTSLATIVVTSVASMRAHHARGTVNWPVVRQMTPGVAVGCIFGAWVAAQISTTPLRLIFAGFEFYIATQMLLEFAPNPHRELPGKIGMALAGSIIGGASSLLGIGGGTLMVPFMVYCNTPMRQAVGTGSALGLPIAVFGCTGFIVSGWQAANLPLHSVGYVYLPALPAIAVTSLLIAPQGARLAHYLEPALLKRIFAAVLYVLAAKMALT